MKIFEVQVQFWKLGSGIGMNLIVAHNKIIWHAAQAMTHGYVRLGVASSNPWEGG